MVLGLYLISLCEPVVSELVDTFLEPNAFMMMLYPNYIILYILDRPPNWNYYYNNDVWDTRQDHV